jgi:hypothetical protein
MAASAPYLPQQDAALQAWAANFDSIVAVDFASLGVSAPEAAAITAAVADFTAKLTLATDPGTRTPVAVAAKNVSRAAMLATIRPIAIRIAIDPSILPEDKTDLGLNPHTSGPTPVSAPGTFPLLDILKATPGCQVIRYRDSDTPTTRAKPYGVIEMQIYVVIGEAAVEEPTNAVYFDSATKSPHMLFFDPADNGKVATLFGRWRNRNGLLGPWSGPVAMTIAF